MLSWWTDFQSPTGRWNGDSNPRPSAPWLSVSTHLTLTPYTMIVALTNTFSSDTFWKHFILSYGCIYVVCKRTSERPTLRPLGRRNRHLLSLHRNRPPEIATRSNTTNGQSETCLSHLFLRWGYISTETQIDANQGCHPSQVALFVRTQAPIITTVLRVPRRGRVSRAYIYIN